MTGSVLLNALFLVLLVSIDRPARFRAVDLPTSAAFTLALVRRRPPPPAAPRGTPRPDRREAPSPAIKRVSPARAAQASTSTSAPPPSPLPAPSAAPAESRPTQDDGETRARVADALRRMSACSRTGDDRDKTDCAAQLAIRRDEEIDTIPTEMREQKATEDARRAYVMSGESANLLQKAPANVPFRGPVIYIHYKCTLKFGLGASGKPHCPGAGQAAAIVRRLAR